MVETGGGNFCIEYSVVFYEHTRYIMNAQIILSSGLFLALFCSCGSDPIVEPVDTDQDPVLDDQLFFTVSNAQQTMIYESRDVTYELTDPLPQLRFKEDTMEVKKMKIRGISASRVRRKSYNVDTHDFISFDNRAENGSYETKDFRLLAMSADLCYIENRIGFGLLQRADIFPLFFKYVEVILNEQSDGLYLMIENPNDYFLDRKDYAILIRRGYYGSIDSYKYSDNADGFSEQDYEAAFGEIYKRIKNFEGEELYAQLDEVLNVRQYMQKIAYDYLIKNGDYTDEIYLYDEPGDSQIRYSVLPWDLDDIFAELPHEVASTFGTGMLFGDRSYATIEDVIADVGEKLLFSIEDDLDYIIAKDSYLYSVYLEELEKLIEVISEDDINQEFVQMEKELTAFFGYEDIVSQTTYDLDACDSQILLEELNEKKIFLINRRQEIIDQL